MRRLNFILAFLVAIFPMVGLAQLNDVDRSEFAYTNLLGPQNNGFESGKAKWTASGGTFAISTSSPFKGKQYATWDSNSGSQTLTSTAVTLPKTGTCEALGWIANSSLTATHLFQAYDGTNILGSVAVVPDTNFKLHAVTFPCPTSGTVSVRIISVASNEPSISVDDFYLGRATTVSAVNPMSEFVSYTPSLTTSGGGAITLNATSQVAINGKWRRVGDLMEVQVSFRNGSGGAASGSAGTVQVSIPTGYTPDTTKVVTSTAGLRADGQALVGAATQTAGSVFINGTNLLAYASGAANYVQVSDIAASYIFTIRAWIPIQGWTSQAAIIPDAQGLSWSGYHGDDCGTWSRTNTAFGDPAVDTACTFTERTNRNFGTVTSAVSGSDKLPGIVFTPKVSGRYFVCATPHAFGPASSLASVAIQMVDGSGTVIGMDSRQMNGTNQEINNFQICGIANLTVASSTLKLQTRASTGAITLGSPTAGLTAIEWSIFAIDMSLQAILANSVYTLNQNGDRSLRVHTAAQCTASPCTISQQSGDVSSITRAGTGDYTVNFTAFSAVPTCVASCGPGAAVCVAHIQSVSTSTVQISTFNSTSGASLDNNAFYVQCVGPR